jgi:uncharacterized membrane protein
MMRKRFVAVSILIGGLPAVAGLLAWARLPAAIPVHWNIIGEADGYGPKAAIFLFSGMIAALTALWALLPGVSPRGYDVERFGPTWWRCGLLVNALLGYVGTLVLAQALDVPLAMDRFICGGIAVLIVLLGNVLGKVRSNFWLGVRTPWTLASERVWYATHRLAGKTMVLGGLLALACVLAGAPAHWATYTVLAGALLPVPYSLLYYKRLERGGAL